jgi:hypothetical protein
MYSTDFMHPYVPNGYIIFLLGDSILPSYFKKLNTWLVRQTESESMNREY